MTSFGLILAMIMGAFKLLANGVISIVNKIPGVNISKMALGGVSKGGLTLVGERGPELVRLPSGARVHSNAESRRMGGGTINVHVNGRVGASDTEIRDIASKVAREINLQMNRQSHTVGRF
jgi:phage-related minor tail protein